jgi:hypothetical protein
MAKIEPIRRPPPRSPERQVLNNAIQQDLDLEAEIKRVGEALDRATALRDAAGATVDAVEEAIERRNDPHRLAERLLSGGEVEDAAPEAARLQKAEADYERASKAAEIIRGQLHTLQSHRNFSKVKDAAGAVARAELRHRLVEEIATVRERYGELYSMLTLVDRGCDLDQSWQEMPEWDADRNPSPKVAALRRWIEALAGDPDAPCPR